MQQADASVRGEGLETIGKDPVVRESDPGDSLVLNISYSAVKPYSCSSGNTDVHSFMGLKFWWSGQINIRLAVTPGEFRLAVGWEKIARISRNIYLNTISENLIISLSIII